MSVTGSTSRHLHGLTLLRHRPVPAAADVASPSWAPPPRSS